MKKSPLIYWLFLFALTLTTCISTSSFSEEGFSSSDDFTRAMAYYKQNKYQEAEKYFLKSAKNGNTAAQYNLFYMYYLGVGISKDYTKAFIWAKKVVEKEDNAMVYNALSTMYANGHGTSVDLKKSFFNLQKAAELKMSIAMFFLGETYASGKIYSLPIDIEKDLPKSFQLFYASANAGYQPAMLKVGAGYMVGRGVPKNLEKSYAWLKVYQSTLPEEQWEESKTMTDGIEMVLTQQQISKAEELASEIWNNIYNK